MAMRNEQIYQAFLHGDLVPLYKEVYPHMLLYAARLLGESYSFLAEDCVQEAIYQTYCHRHQLATSGAFRTYLYSCSYNGAISILRRRASQSQYLAAQSGTGQADEFLCTMIEQETLDLLYRAIDELPERYRTLFKLSFEQGLKNAEVAHLLHISESAVKKQKSQFIRLLRDKFSSIDHGPDTPILYLVVSVMGD